MVAVMDRKAKIVATIGPKSADKDTIIKLINCGMDVARLNFSHGTHKFHSDVIKNIREASHITGKSVAIMQDLQGPKLRVGILPGHQADLKKDDVVFLTEGKEISKVFSLKNGKKVIPLDIPDLCNVLSIGKTIFLDDGCIELEVFDVFEDSIRAVVKVGGILKTHKGINLPNVPLNIPSFTEKDKKDLLFGLKYQVDIVAISFVKNVDDILFVKIFIAENSKNKSGIPIVSKLERSEAIDNLEDIIKTSDGVMVARGDLAVETSPAAVPVIQKRVIQAANKYSTFVITATQMLDSMIHNQRPTRAEASDVANAVFDGTDALMLSGETAIGEYPALSISMMDAIIKEAEEHSSEWGQSNYDSHVDSNDDSMSIARAAGELAYDRNVSAIAVFTQSGRTALMMSKVRPRVIIYAFTPDEQTFRKINVLWGVKPNLVPFVDTVEKMIEKVDNVIKSSTELEAGQQVILVSGFPVGKSRPPNFVFLHDIGQVL